MLTNKLQYRIGGLRVCQRCKEWEAVCAPYIWILLQADEDESFTVEPAKFILFPSFAELRISAKAGCDHCRIWHKAILNECHSMQDETGLFQSPHSLPVEMQTPGSMKAGSLFIKILSPKDTQIEAAPRAVGSRQSNAQRGNALIARDLNGSDIWQQAAQWLADCKSSHECCRLVRSRSLPSRLIHIHESDVTLCDTSDLQPDLAYAALSYVWGGLQEIQLTSQTEARLRAGLHWTRFPPTLRDTFRTCQLLKISYVWIDALCIRQHDGGLDFQQQSAKMDEIYGSATVTLVINMAHSVHEGFLMSRALEQLQMNHKHAYFADRKLFLQRKGLPEVRAKSPIAQRGWCFQEEHLSERLLYFTSHGVFRSCAKEPWAEHGEPWGDSRQYKAAVRVIKPSFFLEGGRQLHIWDQLVGQYSVRTVTYVEDRLTAIRGLARSIERETGEEYLYGMWACRLPMQLLWITLELGEYTESKVTKRLLASAERIPSWSWGSTVPKQAVRMPPPRITYARAKLLETCPFETTTCLVLQGRKRPLLAGHMKLDVWPVKGSIQDTEARTFEDTDPESSLWAYNEVAAGEEGRPPVFVATAEQGTIVNATGSQPAANQEVKQDAAVQPSLPTNEKQLSRAAQCELFVREEGRDPIVIQLDRDPKGCPEGRYPGIELEDLECFEINYTGLLLLEPGPGGTYRRIGCSQLHNDAAFFANAEVTTIKLI